MCNSATAVLYFTAIYVCWKQSTNETAAAPVASIPTAVSSSSSNDTNAIDTSIDGSTLVAAVAVAVAEPLHAGDAIANQLRWWYCTVYIITYTLYSL